MSLSPGSVGPKEMTQNKGPEPLGLSSAIFIGNSDASHGKSLYMKQEDLPFTPHDPLPQVARPKQHIKPLKESVQLDK